MKENKKENTLSTKKKEINQDLDQEKKASFEILLFFFYKFPPLYNLACMHAVYNINLF